MAPRTDIVESFYDLLAPDYDAMTGVDPLRNADRPFYRTLVEETHIRTAVDAGCGTGSHALLLASLGVHVTAVDISEEMLVRTSAHARDAGLEIRTLRSDFAHLRDQVDAPVDAVFCVGNALANVSSSKELIDSLAGFFRVLRPGGMVFIQVVNFDRILQDRNRVQSVKEAGNQIFVRFYDFVSDIIVFNILRLTRTAEGMRHDLRSLPMLPMTEMTTANALAAAGFARVEACGSVRFEPHMVSSSRDLVMRAYRPSTPVSSE